MVRGNVERKLATVLFVDIVDSTQLVTGADPEVVRRRVAEFFDRVSHCVTVHGGIVEKFAGDAVLAAFGIPQAHEDDAERAARAAIGMRAAIRELNLEVRVGIEAGEVVVDQADSTFATGEAVNLAARLQQVAMPGEILVGPTAHRLARGRLLVEDAGPLELKGMGAAMRAWRVLSAIDERHVHVNAALVGRETELELLEHTYERTLRDGRAHIFTIYGEPGVGKSRLAREFVDSVDGASVLKGRCLPYGESVTYWPLAEMIKSAVGITDDEPLEEAFEKLRQCCEDDAVADLIGLAAGLLEAVEGERGSQEISWAAREVMTTLGDVQPLILFFEDIHWAEEPMFDLVEHLADWVRAPLLILCLARPDLLDVRPCMGRRTRAVDRDRARAALRGGERRARRPRSSRSSVRSAAAAQGLARPHRGQSAVRRRDDPDARRGRRLRPRPRHAPGAHRRPHRPPRARRQGAPPARRRRRPRVLAGRACASGAGSRASSALLEDLLLREFVLREPRSSISGESAFRFKHMLIREVAYAGLAKQARAQQHARFAESIKERAGDELLEIRAHHLDHADAVTRRIGWGAARPTDDGSCRGADGGREARPGARAVQVGAEAAPAGRGARADAPPTLLRGARGLAPW